MDGTEIPDTYLGMPVVSLDDWATANAPEWLTDLYLRDGVPHRTIREHVRARLIGSGLRNGYRVGDKSARRADHPLLRGRTGTNRAMAKAALRLIDTRR